MEKKSDKIQREVLNERKRCMDIVKAYPTARPSTLVRKIREGEVATDRMIKRANRFFS